MVGSSLTHILQTLFLGPLISMAGPGKMGLLAAKPNERVLFVNELIESGSVTPVIDARYPLSQAAEALQYLGQGRAHGQGGCYILMHIIEYKKFTFTFTRR
jgi:NADPH:quinone reductase-like Zn-dependent oxidoreductase